MSNVPHSTVKRVPRTIAILRTRLQVAEGAPEYVGAGARSAEPVARLAWHLIGSEAVEVFGVFLLDGKHRVKAWVEVSRGTLTSSLAHPREVYLAAVREQAAAIIVVHNHPSGDPEPSLEDLDVTRRLIEAGRILGVPLLDHLVLGAAPERYVSLRLRGQVTFEG